METNATETEELTDEQRAVLETALEEGYFRVPRETTLVRVAEEHGVSDIEASRRLREALQTVLAEAVEEPQTR